VIRIAELAVVGDNEFVMGFRLIGIKKIFEGNNQEKLEDCFTEVMNDANVGIVVTNENAMEKLDGRFRMSIEDAVTPVVVVLSTESLAQENLRNKIKKAIGIDLLAK